MRKRYLNSELLVNRPIVEVFDFFSKAENLDSVTPPWIRFRILTPLPVDMKKGTLIDYRLRIYGMPFQWRTEITEWDPPHTFTDTQIRGPYRRWVHRHLFEEKDGGTLMIDRVEYSIPGWLLEPLIHWLLVRRNIKKIFAFRRGRFKEILEGSE